MPACDRSNLSTPLLARAKADGGQGGAAARLRRGRGGAGPRAHSSVSGKGASGSSSAGAGGRGEGFASVGDGDRGGATRGGGDKDGLDSRRADDCRSPARAPPGSSLVLRGNLVADSPLDPVPRSAPAPGSAAAVTRLPFPASGATFGDAGAGSRAAGPNARRGLVREGISTGGASSSMAAPPAAVGAPSIVVAPFVAPFVGLSVGGNDGIVAGDAAPATLWSWSRAGNGALRVVGTTVPTEPEGGFPVGAPGTVDDPTPVAGRGPPES
jgi:hypothetical protein